MAKDKKLSLKEKLMAKLSKESEFKKVNQDIKPEEAVMKKEDMYEPAFEPKKQKEVVKEVKTEEDLEKELADIQSKIQEAKEKKLAEQKVEEQKFVQVPIFLTKADLNKMIYENNVMLKQMLSIITGQ